MPSSRPPLSFSPPISLIILPFTPPLSSSYHPPIRVLDLVALPPEARTLEDIGVPPTPPSDDAVRGPPSLCGVNDSEPGEGVAASACASPTGAMLRLCPNLTSSSAIKVSPDANDPGVAAPQPPGVTGDTCGDPNEARGAAPPLREMASLAADMGVLVRRVMRSLVGETLGCCQNYNARGDMNLAPLDTSEEGTSGTRYRIQSQDNNLQCLGVCIAESDGREIGTWEGVNQTTSAVWRRRCRQP